MPISVTCICGQEYQAEDHLAGEQMQCPMCNAALPIPDPRLPPNHPVNQRASKPAPRPQQPQLQQPQLQRPQQPQRPAPQQPVQPQQPVVPQQPLPHQQPQQPTQPQQPVVQPQQQPAQLYLPPKSQQPQQPHPQTRPQQPAAQEEPVLLQSAPQPQQQPRPQQPAAGNALDLGSLSQVESMLPATSRPLGGAGANPLLGSAAHAANSQMGDHKWLYISVAFGGGVLLLLGLMVVMSGFQSSRRVASSDSSSREDEEAETDSGTPSAPSAAPSSPPSAPENTATAPPNASGNGLGASAAGSSAASPAAPYGPSASRPPGEAPGRYADRRTNGSNSGASAASGESTAAGGDSGSSSAESSGKTLAFGADAWHTASGSDLRGMRRMSGKDAENEMLAYSWMCELLPHLGHQSVYDQFDFKQTWAHDPNQLMARVVIPEFLNPDDDRERWKGYPFQGLALTHFVGMAGVEDQRNVVAATLPRSDPRAGVFGYDEAAHRDDVTDGASETIMMIGSGELASPWVQGGGATVRGARESYFDRLTGFGSHGMPERGAIVVMADGSTRHISADIDPAVFRALCTIHGNDTVDRQHLGEPFEMTPRKREHSKEGPAAGNGETKIIILR